MNKLTLDKNLKWVNTMVERIRNGNVSDTERVRVLDKLNWLYKWKHISAKEYLVLTDRVYYAYVDGGLIKDDR